MFLKKLDNSNNKDIQFVEKLYLESFPSSERRATKAMFDLNADESNAFTIQIVMEENQYLGFLTYWNLKDFVFAEHFAIDSEFRNGGYGGKVMELFIESTHSPIVLEVELPNTTRGAFR